MAERPTVSNDAHLEEAPRAVPASNAKLDEKLQTRRLDTVLRNVVVTSSVLERETDSVRRMEAEDRAKSARHRLTEVLRETPEHVISKLIPAERRGEVQGVE